MGALQDALHLVKACQKAKTLMGNRAKKRRRSAPLLAVFPGFSRLFLRRAGHITLNTFRETRNYLSVVPLLQCPSKSSVKIRGLVRRGQAGNFLWITL
ncbi:MAG: hypothetical protein LBE51_15285 [Acidovorax sp.]|jgi:hypothetical protein|nr:hypothetical protein [Acidovorax sp.]